MRANSSNPSLVVVVLILVGGCTPPEDETVVLAPAEPSEPRLAPDPEPTLDELLDPVLTVRPGPAQTDDTQPVPTQSGPAQAVINGIRERSIVDREASTVPPGQPIAARTVDRLIYQCTDDITFAVRVTGTRLQVFPPGYSNGFIMLERAAADDGVRYVAHDADFRAKGDLATLHVGRARYVDCVSNPAAAVWQEPRRTR